MNPLLLKKQLKDNATDLEEFTSDLKRWGEEMKRKETNLKGKVEAEENSKQKKPRCSPSKNGHKRSLKKAGTTDYAAWDKFDADAELERLDGDLEEDEMSDECNQEEMDKAALEKEKGNKFVKEQKWDDAIVCYTKAIQCYSYDPIYYANRALCYLKKNLYPEAEKDCNFSLKLDRTYVKAYQRRAAAKIGMKKFEEAEQDFLKVLEFEPKNKETLKELENLRQKLKKTGIVKEQRPVSKFSASRNKSVDSNRLDLIESQVHQKIIDEGKGKTMWPGNDDEEIIEVKAINKPPRLRSQKPLKRIEIVEIGENIDIKPDGCIEPIKANVIEKQPFSEKALSPHKIEENDKIDAWPKTEPTTLTLSTDDFKIVERSNPNDKINKNTSNITKTASKFNSPKGSIQFYLDWKNLKSTNEKYEYLKRIDLNEIPKVFLNSLESEIFSEILEILLNHYVNNKDSTFELLKCFSRVKGFDLITMFFSSRDRNNLEKLFEYMAECKVNNEDLNKLRHCYGL